MRFDNVSHVHAEVIREGLEDPLTRRLIVAFADFVVRKRAYDDAIREGREPPSLSTAPPQDGATWKVKVCPHNVPLWQVVALDEPVAETEDP